MTEDTFAPWGLALDIDAGDLYWTEPIQGKIRRSSTDGHNVENVVARSVDNIKSLAVDSQSRSVYWTTSRNDDYGYSGRIQSSNYDGTNLHDVITDLAGAAESFLDIDERVIYWRETHSNPNSTTIRRVNTDGSGLATVLTFGNSDDDRPTGAIAISKSDRRLYWVAESSIWSANTDGTDVRPVVEGLDEPRALSINEVPHIRRVDSGNCSIDARTPVDSDNNWSGWNTTDLYFSRAFLADDAMQLDVTQIGGHEEAPKVSSLEMLAPDVVRVNLDRPIEPDAWTCLSHFNSATKICVGFLPGDVNGDGTASPNDILSLIDSLNGVSNDTLPVWQSDIDRSGQANAMDILELINLLNESVDQVAWNGRSLSPCP